MSSTHIKRTLGVLLGSSLLFSANPYSFFDHKDKNAGENLDLHSSGVSENLLKLQKLEEKVCPVKRTKPLLRKSIDESKIVIKKFMTTKSIPGLVVSISHRGDTLWTKGFGFANLEQGSKCHGTTAMRIASISKPMTMLLVAKLVEDGKLDLDEPIYTYLKDKFPRKSWQGQPVNITLRQLTSHLGGIRSYKKEKPEHPIGMPDEDMPEFYSRDVYKSVYDSLKMFENDDLTSEPGSKFLYSTLAWTLVSAVVQSVLDDDKAFETYWVQNILRKQLGMVNTTLDWNLPLINNRANYYFFLKNRGTLMNCPSVENSYKWAGGGLVSTVGDVVRFGNVMLYSFLGGKTDPTHGHLKGYLKKETVQELWTPIPNTGDSRCRYSGLGWFRVTPESMMKECAFCTDPPFDNVSYHTGGAVGASSILMILPEEEIVIAILCNLQNVSLYDLAVDIVKCFCKQLNPSS